MRAFAGALVAVLSSTMTASPATATEPISPRLLVGLAGTAKATAVRVTVRNVSPRSVSFRSLTRLALRRVADEDRTGRPHYWAPLDLLSARSPETDEPRQVRLGPGQSRDLVVDLRDLAWAEGGCACWPDGTLTRVVVPGHYELLVEIEDPDSSFWWRSNTGVAVMKRSRALEVSFE